MCCEYKLVCLKWFCQLLFCFDGKLYLVHWWKMFIVPALSNMGAWNQASCDPKTQPSHKRCMLVCCLAGRCKSYAISTSVWKWSFCHFVAIMLKLQQFVIIKPDIVRHWRRAAIQQICQHRLRQASLYLRHTMTSWHQHYITTSKEYLTNSHILSK